MLLPVKSIRSTASFLVLLLVGCTSSSETTVVAQEDSAKTAPQSFALVELFTSQGCSSCPPADQNLQLIAEQAQKNDLPIYTLSFHVDYWNRLGWNDPFSSEAASQRQRWYAKVFNSDRVYTPQMIVNGTTEFVGSDRDEAAQAIASALQEEPTAKLTHAVKQEKNRVLVRWNSAIIPAEHVLNAALVQNSAQRKVTAGENTGRQLEHVNVVRDFQTVNEPDKSFETTLRFPADADSSEFHLVLYMQSKADGTIIAARQVALK